MNARELAMSPEQLLREREHQADAKRRAKAARRARTARAAGPSREERRAADDARELAGKAAAMSRSRCPLLGGPRCEDHTAGRRCAEAATDADHVLGGRWKKDMEELPNGEGFQAKCRTHHDIKHGPAKRAALLEAKEHAIRIGSRGLLRHVEAAIARYEAKHPEARR